MLPVVTFLLLSLVGTPSHAATTPPTVSLDLPAATELALERSLQISAAWQGAEAAAQVVEQVQALKRGKVGLEAEYLHLNDEIGMAVDLPPALGLKLPPIVIVPQELLRARVQAGLPLYTGNKIERAVQQATYGAEAFKAFARDTESAVMLEVSEYYLGALLARDVVKVQQQALDTYRQHLDQANKVFRAGVVARYDVIRAETAVKDQEKKVSDAQNQYDLALSALRTALVMDRETPIELRGSLQEVSESLTLLEAQKIALTDNDALKALDNKSLAYQMAGKVEEAGGRPQVAAIGQVELLTGNLAATDPEWTVGVKATYDLYDGGARKAKVREQQVQQRKTETERQHAGNQIQLAIQSAYLDMGAARVGLEASHKSAELAEESLRLAQRRFEFGVGTSLEVLDATTTLAGARVGETQSLYQLDKAWLKLHRYVGDLRAACRRAGL